MRIPYDSSTRCGGSNVLLKYIFTSIFAVGTHHLQVSTKGLNIISVYRKILWKRNRLPLPLSTDYSQAARHAATQSQATNRSLRTIHTVLCVRTLPYSATETMHNDAMAHKPILLRARARILCLSPSHSTVMVALKPPSPPSEIRWRMATGKCAARNISPIRRPRDQTAFLKGVCRNPHLQDGAPSCEVEGLPREPRPLEMAHLKPAAENLLSLSVSICL